MRKIIDYSYVRVTTEMAHLVPLVRECLNEGWEPFGEPVLSNPYKYQFLVKYEEIK